MSAHASAAPDLSVVIVNWNTRQLVLDCLATLPAGAGALAWEAFVVDNGSSDGSAEAVRAAFPAVRVIANAENRGFAAANNQAAVLAAGRHVLFLNSDTLVPPGSLETLVRFADARSDVGVVGARLLNADGSFQGSYMPFPALWTELLSVSGLGARLVSRGFPSGDERASRVSRGADVICGACMLVRAEAGRRVGWMDEDYGMYSEEAELSMRMRQAGLTTWYCADATIVHLGGQSTRQRRRDMLVALYRSKIEFFRRHRGPLRAAVLRAAAFLALRAKSVRGHMDGPPVRWSELSL